MISEQRRQESGVYWFGSPAARNVLEEFAPSGRGEETILTDEGQEPEPVTLTPETNIEDVVRNPQEPTPEVESEAQAEDQNPLFFSDSDRARLQTKLQEQGLDRIKTADPFPDAPRSLTEEGGVGFGRGVDQLQAMGFGLLGLMGESLEVEGLSDLGVEGYKRNMEEAAKNQASVQDPFEEIGGVGDAALYATGVLSEQLPQLLVSLLGGGVGGYTAKTIAKKVVANEIGKRVAAGLEKEAAEKVVANLVAQKALRGFDVPVVREGVERMATRVGQEALQQATKAGALGGAYVANVGQIAGGSFGEIEQETGERDPVNALGFALLGGALETAGEALIAAPVANRLIGGRTLPKLGEVEARRTAIAPLVSGAGRLAGTATSEGLTERGQTFLEQAAVGAADPNRTIAEVTGTPEAQRERDIATVAGVVAGGGLGGVSQAASYLIPETAKAVQSKLRQRQAEQPQEEQEPALAGDWSQPVKVDDVTMQRNSSGLWAVVNPNEDLLQGFPRLRTEDGNSLLVVTPEADEEGRAAFLVARAEKALSDLDEGEIAADFQAQEETQPEPEDELGDPVELDEETEATRMRQSPQGATALRQQLAEQEEVAASLAESTAAAEQSAQPIKAAEDSARVIDAELSEQERIRRGEEGAMGVAVQAGRQERVASAIMAPEVGTGEALQRVREAGIVGDQSQILVSNFFDKRKKELEVAREERRKAAEAALARPPIDAENFIQGLNTGDRVGLIGGQQDAGLVFVGRRKNGNAVFETFLTSPNTGDKVGSATRIELPPSQFQRVYLAPPPASTRTPLEQAFDDALGPNPTKQQAERVLGSPYTGTRGAQKSTFSDGLGSEAFPIEISWFNKKGDKGTIIPSIRGTSTNSPFTTVRQMNQGLEVVVPDDQLGSLSKDIQVEAVSDKKGGRKNIVTGVNLWGRTYRRGLRSPKDFSVDIPLTKRGAGARKQGLLLFDNIYKNSPERIARSEAAVRGAQERQTPPEQMLREWELVQAGLNPVEYTFYEDALGRATDFINRSNLPENVKDEARFEAQNNIVKSFGNRKKRRGKQPAEGTAALAKTYLEELAKLREGRLQKTRERATRLIGNIERNPQRMSDVEIARASDSNPLRGPVLGSVAGPRAADVEERAIDEAMKGNEVDLDRAVEATLKRLAKEQPNRRAREVFDTRKALKSIAESYKNIGKFNPIYTAMNAVRTADRSIRRREMNEQTELITDREARERAGRQRAEEPETTQQNVQGEIDRALQAETVQAVDRAVLPEQADPETTDEAPEINPDDPMLDQVSDARDRFFNLTEEDQILVLSNRRLNLDERGRPISGQKSNLTQAQKRRAKQIEQYLQRKQTYANLYPESPVAPQQPRRGDQPAAQIPVSRFSSGEVLAGVAESGARGRPRTDTQGRPESVGRPDRAGAGTVSGTDNVRDGGLGVRASLAPQTVRRLSRAAKSRFVQSFGRLTDAEASALTEAEIDRAYEAIVTRKNAATVRANRIISGETPRSLADLGAMSGSELLAGAVDAMRTYEADRARVQIVRDNVGALLRARAFADVSTFLGAVNSGNAPQDVKLRAREFSKLLGRGIDLNAVGVQIGRFGDDTSWAGLFTRDNGNTYNVALNLDAQHDRASAINTMLHELSHVVTSKKIRGEVRLNNVERNAIDRLEALRREALVAAARDVGLDVPTDLTDADYERLANDLDQRALPQNDPEGTNRVYASLGSLEEFTVEVSSSPELAGLMARLGFGQARGRVTLLNAIRDAWNALVELVSGVKADPNSPLARAFKDSWILNYSNAGGEMNLGDYTMPEIRRSAINRELARRQGIEDEINREVEARNLAGTTAEREAILAEMFDPSVTASAARVQRAANRLTQDEFVQWAQKSGFNFVDPVAVYNNNRTTQQAAPEQATGDTVQVAESRAVGSQVAVVPDNGVEKEFHTLNTVEDTNGDVGLDLSKLIGSLRDKASEVSEQVFGKKFLVIIDDEQREFTTLPALQKFLTNAGIPDGTVARVFRNGNNQIAVNFDEIINQATDRAIRKQTRDVAESRAVRRVTPQQDTDYLAAVERGDTETAQQLETSAATSAGYMLRGKHGTPRGGFNVFDTRGERIGVNENDRFTPNVSGPDPSAFIGSHFAIGVHADRVSRDFARGLYQGRLVRKGRNEVYDVHLKINNPKFYTAEEFEEAILTQSVISNRYFHDEWFDENAAEYGVGGRDALEMLGTDDGIDILADMYRDYSLRRQREAEDLEVYDLALNEAREIGQDLRSRLEMDGHDGVIYDNLAEGGQAAIVFNPSQIKRAGVTRDDQGNVIPLSQRFNEASPDIRESRAVGRPFASETATTYNGKTYTRPGLIFGENANLDPRATELISILKRVKRAAEQYANLKGQELNRLIKKYYKNQPVPTDLINDALGNLDNPLTDQQFNEIKRLELTDPEAAVKQRIAYLNENRARFRTERQAPALLSLPEELSEFLREIGKDGDLAQLQEEALKLGIPKGDMAAAFTDNLGIYLTRSYNAFIDQEGWERTLRAEDAALGEQSRMGQMRNTIRTTLIGQRADDLQAAAMAEGRTLSRGEAERQAKEGTTTEEVDQMLESYIAYTKEEASSESFSGLRLPGRQNIKSLEQRKMLSDALREFYGQVENPAVNFVTSYAKLSSLIANHKFQTDLKNLGLKEGWLWDQEKNLGQRPPSGYERIAADNDKSLKVLAGLYARSDLVRGLRETFPPNSMEAAQWWLHPFMKLTGLSMGLKTVGSIVSQIRNYWSSYAPIIAGGNMTIADWFRPEWRKNWKEAHEVSIANVFRKYGGDRKKMTDRIKRLYELGVMGESLTVGLLNDLTRLGKDASISDEQFFNNFEKILKKPGRRVWNATKQVWEKAEQVYGMTDDIFKVLTYLSEFDKYQKVYPNMSESELEQKAANIARDIHWTYSKAPAAVNELKKFPFIAPFVTFTTETIRITANLGKLAINERKEGQRLREQGLRENNAELVRQGDELLKISNKRMRGMAAVAFGPWAVGSLAMTAAGFSGDDEEDLRQFLPDWQKNSQIIILGRNGTDINYVDVSYLDPFEVWKKPVTAFMRGLGRAENVEEFFTEAVVGAALEAARPFTSEQILSGAVMDVMRNRDANGRQVYNPQDTGTAIATAVGAKLTSAFTPGTMDTVDRIYKASAGQMSETGRAYQPFNEWGSLVFGQRVSAVDAEQALGFKASQFLRARRDARSIFNRDYLSRGSRSESDVISAYQRSNVGLRDVTEQLRREYIAALNLGLSPAKARSVLRASGLDRDSARMVSTGIYRRLTPSEEQDRMAAPERKRAARQAIAETPQREVLFP
jgi:hypothetical protein